MSVSLLNSPPPSQAAVPSLSGQAVSRTVSERTPLLNSKKVAPSGNAWLTAGSVKRAFFMPNPYWVIPFWLIASFSRGMTLAPRVEVYTHLACQAYHHETSAHPHPHASAAYDNHEYPDTPSNLLGSLSTRPYTPVDFGALLGNETRMTHPKHEYAPSDSEDKVIARAPEKACLKDPVVQQHAARLQMAVVLTMGILSAATTGWWSTVSDRLGRTRVMAASLFGYLFTDVMFIVVARNAKLLVPFGGHRLLMLGPVMEGLLGGWSTCNAAVNAYISDVTDHGSRAKSFSTTQGMMFVGVAAGPAFGSIILRWTPDILGIFAASVIISLLTVCYAAFIMPESLTDEIRAERERKRIMALEEHLAHIAQAGAGWWHRFKVSMKEFIAPAAMFLPRGNDWRPTLVGIAWSATLLTAGSYPLKLLYAEHMFGWTAAQMGNYLTIIGSVRALWLLVALPFLIKLLKPAHPSELKEAHVSFAGSPTVAASPDTGTQPSVPGQSNSVAVPAAISQTPSSALVADLSFDIRLARLSYFIDAISYILVTIVAGASSEVFVMATLLSAIGGGAVPATQSISLCLLSDPREDAGKMLGALSMAQAVSSTIISPLVFGTLYSETVKVFPEAIFVCGACLVGVSCLSMLLVRPSIKQKRKRIVRRGRSTRRKPLASSMSSRATSQSHATDDEHTHV